MALKYAGRQALQPALQMLDQRHQRPLWSTTLRSGRAVLRHSERQISDRHHFACLLHVSFTQFILSLYHFC